MSFDKNFDVTAGVYFYFYHVYMYLVNNSVAYVFNETYSKSKNNENFRRFGD